MKRFLLLVVCAALLLVGQVSAQNGGPDLFVDAGQSLGPISPYVYGANYSPLSIVPVDLLDEAQVSGIKFLRFPGGRWADQNNLQKFQVKMFIKLCEQMGAEPSLVARLEGGTPEQAVELLQMTIDEGYNVRYWSIGNEPNLFDDYTTEQHNREWRAIAEAMLAVDPNIILIGPDTSQYTGNPAVDPKDAEGRDFLREFLLANGDLVDIVAVHRYPFPRSQSNPVTTIDDLRQNAAEWTEIVHNLRAVIKETTGRDDLPIAMTEANSSWAISVGGEATTDSLYNAIWWADVLGRLITEQMTIVNYFELQTPTERGTWGLLGSYKIFPTYYTYQLYQQFGAELVYSSYIHNDLTVYAARRDDGALTLIVVNLGADEQSPIVQIDNFEIGGPAQVWRLDAAHNAETVEEVDLSAELITVPGQSVTLYVVPGQ